MIEKPILINDKSKVDAVYKESDEYLVLHGEILVKNAQSLFAYHTILKIVPHTSESLWSGHYFPFSESYFELESAYLMCLEGFYAHAFRALRSVLELGLLGAFFDIDNQGHSEVQPWLRSQTRTPRIQQIVNVLRQQPAFSRFDSKFKIADRILQRFDALGGYVHTRGYRHSSSALARANFNQFAEEALTGFCEEMYGLIADVVTVMLLKYPMGLQGIPFHEKFGVFGPVGGILNPHEVSWITAVVPDDELLLLQQLSDEDPDVQSLVEQIQALPDITDEELALQERELDDILRAHRPKNIESADS